MPEQESTLIKLRGCWFNKHSRIGLENGYVDLAEDSFIAVGLEKSKAAKNWEDEDCFKVTILTQGADDNYYYSTIEHRASILAPKYVNDDWRIHWIEDTKPKTNLLIDNLYALGDSRCQYTLTVDEKPYSFYEKYIVYNLTASYEIEENYNKSQEIEPFIIVRCQFASHHGASALEDTPSQTLEYPIEIGNLLQTSIFQYRPFEVWQGKVIVENLTVTLTV